MTVLRWMCLIAVLFVAAACSETNKDQCKLPEDCPGGFDCVDGKCVNTGLNDSDETTDATDTESGLPDKENGLPDGTDGLPDDSDIAPDGDGLPDTADVTPDADQQTDTEDPETDTPLIDDSDDDLLGEGETPEDDPSLTDDDGEQPETEVEWPDVDTDVQICTPNQVQTCVYTGDPLTLNVGPCKAGTKQCNGDGTAWSNCTGEVIPSSDVCTDIIDNDCNATINDGYSTGATGCVCLPNEGTSCYTGPGGTEGVGECHAGTKTCGTYGNNWGSCLEQVTPITEICANGLNDDCVGGADDGLDADGDGWSTCANDCCDSEAQCQNPAVVNPGAVEVEGDSIDNDCNGSTDEAPTACSAAQKFSGIGPTDLVQAIGICKTSVNGSWGVVGTPTILRSDLDSVLCSSPYTTCSAGLISQGASAIDIQTAVMGQFGSDASNAAIEGTTMAALSSGRARDNFNDPDPTAVVTYRYDFGQPPADFVAAHGGSLPTTSAGCPASTGTNISNDAVMLSVQLKVPTNANSFSFNFRFFSQEYWSYTCQEYNDFFVTLLDTSWTPGLGEQPIPADKNISFDSNGSYISVNSTNFFTVCNAKAGYTCPDGTGALSGTGYAPANAGATKWLATAAPVVPGETITLRFVIWDTSDTSLDSLVIIDNFKWSAAASGGPVTFECWDINQNGTCDVATEDLSGDGVCNERDC